MADRLYLSYWLRGFTEHNQLRHFEKLIERFPFSRQTAGLACARVWAVSFTEPPLFEQTIESDATRTDVIRTAREFHHADCALEIEGAWDLWRWNEGWKLTPSGVSLFCFGPEFDSDDGDHLRIDFGVDADFLPQPELADSVGYVQSNVKGLLRLVHDLDNVLAVERRQLRSESGENFAEKLEAALDQQA